MGRWSIASRLLYDDGATLGYVVSGPLCPNSSEFHTISRTAEERLVCCCMQISSFFLSSKVTWEASWVFRKVRHYNKFDLTIKIVFFFFFHNCSYECSGLCNWPRHIPKASWLVYRRRGYVTCSRAQPASELIYTTYTLCQCVDCTPLQ